MEPITQQDLDALMDIFWWIKGYMAGDACGCPFSGDHMKALKNAKCELQTGLLRKAEDCQPAPAGRF